MTKKPSGKSNKPTLETLSYLDYFEVQRYIDHLKGKDYMDQSGLWYEFCDDITNGSYYTLYIDCECSTPEAQEALDLIFEEFAEYVEENALNFYVCW